MRVFGGVLFWVGLLLCIGSVVVGLVLGGRTVDQLRAAVSDAVPMADGTATIELADGDRRGIYEVTRGGSSSAECSVVGPGGTDVGVSSGFDLQGSAGGTDYVYVGDFEAPADGSHAVSCSGGQTVLGPSLDLGALGGGVVAVLAGIAGFLLGALLVLVGAVLWLIGRSRDRNAAARAAYGGQLPPSW